MSAAISPWHSETIESRSPDGRFTAVVHEPTEIAMGAPTSGELKVSNGQSGDGCSPSIVWSDDSRFLAVPQWTKDREQRLMILNVETRERKFAPQTYRVLALASFSGGIVRGVDSPIHEPVELAFDVRALFE